MPHRRKEYGFESKIIISYERSKNMFNLSEKRSCDGCLVVSYYPDTDGSEMIYRTIGRTIVFTQVRFPAINSHPRPDPVSVFVRYPRHRLRSVPMAAVCATGRDPGHELASAPSSAICAGTLKKTKQSRSLR
jgi:hypothetical protein